MYFIDDSTLVTSASDLTQAASCEFAFLSVLDRRLGWNADPIPEDDAMLKLAAKLGDVHERTLLAKYRSEFGDRVVEIDRPERTTPEQLRELAARTRAALASGAPVVFQGVFFDESTPQRPFSGFADFLVRQPSGDYRVVDTKLARHVKSTALMQLAAYHDQLARWGVAVDDTVELILGDQRSELAHIDDITPVWQVQRERMHSLINSHIAGGTAVRWGDDALLIDGNCKFCTPEIAASNDLLLVANLRKTQRAKLRAAGISSIDDLARTPERPADCSVPESTYRTLQQQAALQVQARDTGGEVPPFTVVDARAIEALPAHSPGDLFFDFEGDPMFLATLPDGRPLWGLDYLFGWVDATGQFDKLWAHSLNEEKQALIDFLAFVEQRRQQWPDLHIYHYAAYEKTHLLSIAARHGVGEAAMDRLLREGVLVDLLPVVRKALRVGSPSYSIKKLEPLYMSDDAREGVSNAADSVVEYRRACELRDAGDASAQDVFDDIERYNAYDCVSTLGLRNWLLTLPGVGAPGQAARGGEDGLPFEESQAAGQLRARAEALLGGGVSDSANDRARAFELAAAALDFHTRENKAFWHAHYFRLEQPADLWDDTRDVFTVASARIEADWHLPERARVLRRIMRVSGDWAPGSRTSPKELRALYAPGFRPADLEVDQPEYQRWHHSVVVLDAADDGSWLLVQENKPAGAGEWTESPTHFVPNSPLSTKNIQAAIADWADELAEHGTHEGAAWQLLCRTDARPVPRGHIDGTADAVVATLTGTARGFLAVQGPPGTGKTYLAGQVIAQLAGAHNWKIGVVAQSHKVVENALESVISAGLDAGLVGKAEPSDVKYSTVPFTVIPNAQEADFLAGSGGRVLGGTAWTFTDRNRVQADELDLLVIDEAGQFSLANTIAVGLAAKRILLLGDPQQLPQVTQGTHPAPVDGSALGHLSGSAAVLPERFGYFLEQSRRMDPAVTAAVSALSYDGELESHATTAGRALAGVTPGLHPVAVEHLGNAVSSAEEAVEVVRIAREHLGRAWTDADGSRPLEQSDVIVITPYNAQVHTIREALDAAGLGGVDVGTADKYQGREAVISIVSLAASDAAEVPRGIDFLLSRNRLNVAVSRAKWAAYLLYSPGLLRHLPPTLESMAALSGFIRLTRPASRE